MDLRFGGLKPEAKSQNLRIQELRRQKFKSHELKAEAL
jgi:hypothetical protein